MADDSKERVSLMIIRKRSKGGHGGHHGGAWKIAYADFVTAMMAFFLLMWLLGSTTKGEKAGIAEYFNTPLRVALNGGEYSGGATSVLDGGGADMSRKDIGDVTRSDNAKQTVRDTPKSKEQAHADDIKKLKGLKAKIEALIDNNPKLKPFRNQIRLDITSEGLRIQITDAKNRPMFASGSAVLAAYTKDILDEIAGALNDVDNRISIAGHTDSMPYSGGEKGYSNWELSGERANAARRELIAGGMIDKKVVQVRGLADALPLDANDVSAPMNRRISIVVLNHDTLAAFYRDGGRMDVGSPAEAASAVTASGALMSAGAGARKLALAPAPAPAETGAASSVAAAPGASSEQTAKAADSGKTEVASKADGKLDVPPAKAEAKTEVKAEAKAEAKADANAARKVAVEPADQVADKAVEKMAEKASNKSVAKSADKPAAKAAEGPTDTSVQQANGKTAAKAA